MIELAAIPAIGTLIWLLVYSPFVEGCCDAFDTAVLILFAPAILIASIVAGGFAHATRAHALVGIVGEVAIIWIVVRGGIALYRRIQRKDNR